MPLIKPSLDIAQFIQEGGVLFVLHIRKSRSIQRGRYLRQHCK